MRDVKEMFSDFFFFFNDRLIFCTFYVQTANRSDGKFGATDEIGNGKTVQSFCCIEKRTRHVVTVIRTVAQHYRNR